MPPEAQERARLAEEKRDLTLAFINSLTEAQIEKANRLATVDYPNDPPSQMERGKGLGYADLNDAQKAMLERLWELYLTRRPDRPVHASLSPPGPIEEAEVFNVQYAIEHRSDFTFPADQPKEGPVLTVSFQTGRYPRATIFIWQGNANAVKLAPALLAKGIDAVAREGIRTGGERERRSLAAKEAAHRQG